jgi:hypothetical protein
MFTSSEVSKNEFENVDPNLMIPLETVSLMLKIITYGVQTEMQAVADF